jgi:hypothetical protein
LHSEYERYQFIQQIILARYEAYLTNPSSFILTELDTNPNCHILSQSIYYMHMTFEQLESIQNDIHPLTRQRLVSEKVLKEALWLQVKLRSKIESASERDTKLNMTVSSSSAATASASTATTTTTTTTTTTRSSRSSSSSGKEGEEEDEEEYEDSNEEEEEEREVQQQGKLGKAAKYYPIPTDDTTTYTGESAIPLAASSIMASSTNNTKKMKSSMHTSSPASVVEQYSIYPPFRFSVEFSDVNLLKHGMRVYSDTVFYAG